MKRSFKIKVMIVTLIFVFVLSFLVVNRYYYGTFNIFSDPVRVVYGGMHYNHRSFGTLSGKEKPGLEISRLIDIITGKRIFCMNKDFIGPGNTIYLHLEGERYILYSSGGGG